MSDMVASAAGQLGQATGVSNIGQGISDLFSGGQTPAAGQPGGPELVGPPSPVASPNFLQGFVQGFTGMNPGQGADVPMGPGTELAGGVGQLFHAINTMRNPQGLIQSEIGKLLSPTPGAPGDGQTPVVNLAPKPNVPSVDMTPGYVQSSAPQSGLLHRIIQGLTYGILDSPKMGGSSGQI